MRIQTKLILIAVMLGVVTVDLLAHGHPTANSSSSNTSMSAHTSTTPAQSALAALQGPLRFNGVITLTGSTSNQNAGSNFLTNLNNVAPGIVPGLATKPLPTGSASSQQVIVLGTQESANRVDISLTASDGTSLHAVEYDGTWFEQQNNQWAPLDKTNPLAAYLISPAMLSQQGKSAGTFSDAGGTQQQRQYSLSSSPSAGQGSVGDSSFGLAVQTADKYDLWVHVSPAYPVAIGVTQTSSESENIGDSSNPVLSNSIAISMAERLDITNAGTSVTVTNPNKAL